MRLVLDSDPRINLVRRYGDGEILIGDRRLTAACIVSPSRLIADWGARSIPELSEPLLEPILALHPNIVLLGQGEMQSFPSAPIRASFRARGIALECMNLGAACRTYNILANEERPVVAGLFP